MDPALERQTSDSVGLIDQQPARNRSFMMQSFERSRIEEVPMRVDLQRTGSLTSAQLAHASSQPSFRNPLKPTDTSQLFDKFSHDFVHELEKQHERALANAYFKLTAQEDNHNKIVEALKAQIAALRQQIDVNKQLFDREEVRRKKDFDDALRSAMGDKERIFTDLQYKYEESRRAAEEESQRNFQLMEELAAFKAQHQEEVAQANATIKDLQQEILMLRNDSLFSAEKEIEKLRAEKKALKEDFERIIQALKRDHLDVVEELRKRIESKDSLVQHLETEVNEVRRQMAVRGEAFEREMTEVQESLRTARQVLSSQDEDIRRLRKAREESGKEARLLEKETTLLEHELARMRKDNDDLRGHGFRMEKLVYGKGTKKQSKKTNK